MRNLGDYKKQDRQRGDSIRNELELVGIEVLSTEDGADHGRLGPFRFHRAWYYWRVAGDVPLPVALELWDHPIGRKSVRVAGMSGGAPPEPPWLEDRPRGPVVPSYDIDTGAALRLFVETIRKHGLDRLPAEGPKEGTIDKGEHTR